MKKKYGFTLAEVLITLGIVGVIAALTLPNLMNNTSTAQIGPKLAKGVSAFEQANKTMINSYEVDKLTDTGILDATNYGPNLSNYLLIAEKTDGKYLSKDGIMYTFTINTSLPDGKGFPHNERVGDVTIDINGDAGHGEDGTDVFYFSWWNDGSLRPKGATNWDGGQDYDCEFIENTTTCKTDEDGKNVPTTTVSDSESGRKHWKSQCNIGVSPTDAKYCAGHVFENNLKVLYR